MRCLRAGGFVGAVFTLSAACADDEVSDPFWHIDGGRGGMAGAGGATGGAASTDDEGGAGGSAPSCPPPTASPSRVRVGEVALLELPGDGSPSIADATSRVRARLFEDSDGNWELLCRAGGDVQLNVYGECDTAELVVSCIEERECCPIDATDGATGCAQFGGSPPCYTGCACTGDPNTHESIIEDENGCLMRSLTSVADGEVVPCETPDGDVELDPREPVFDSARCESAPLEDDLPRGVCSGLAKALAEADRPSLGEGGAAGEAPVECEPDGLWRIEIPVQCAPRDSCGFAIPSSSGLVLEAPTELVPSTDGCELSFVTERPWEAGSECGVAGYRIDLRVDGDAATGSIRSAESGRCNGEATSFVRATRVR